MHGPRVADERWGVSRRLGGNEANPMLAVSMIRCHREAAGENEEVVVAMAAVNDDSDVSGEVRR